MAKAAVASKTPKNPQEQQDREAAQAAIAARDDAQDDERVEDAPAAERQQQQENRGAPRDAENAAGDRAVREGKVEYRPDPRADIAASIHARRKAGDEADEDEATINEVDDLDAIEDEDEPEAAAAGQEQQQEQQRQEPRRVRLAELDPNETIIVKIRGQDQEVAVSDLLNNAQMYLAGEEHLRRAREAQPGERQQQNDVRPGGEADQPARREPSTTAASPLKKRTKEELVALADKVQGGTAEEAAEVLGQIEEDAIRRATEIASEAVDERLNQREVDRRAADEAAQAITTLAARHKTLMERPMLAKSVFGTAYERMRDGLKEIGVPAEELSAPATEIITGYARLRQHQHWSDKLKPMEAIYDEVAQAAEKENGIAADPNPQREQPGQQRQQQQQPTIRRTVTREERRTAIQPQPRSANIRTDATGVNGAVARRDPSATIARMRDSRTGVRTI